MELIVFCGVQGSGKSSFYLERFYHTHLRLSLDLLKTRHRQDALLYAALAAQQPVVIDNTNPQAKTRARYLALGRAAGFRCVLYYFEATAEEALRRNAGRAEALRVPDVAVLGTLKKLEPPTVAEGFDQLFRVRIGERGFEVTEVTS